MVNRAALLGTVTGYVLVLVRILTGLVTFRLAYGALDARELGFYAVVWSLLSLLGLFDFGGGYTLQRLAGALAGRTDGEAQQQRREAFSTVLGLSGLVTLGLGLVATVAVVVGGMAGWLPSDLRPALIVFLMTVLAAFPFGSCKEVLRGRQLHWVCNLVDLGCALVGVSAVWFTVRAGGGLVALVAVGGGMTLLNNLLYLGLATVDRDWRTAWSMISVARARSLASFSLATWTISLLNVLLRCDQAVIGVVGSLAQVATYAPGTRVQNLVMQATGQVLGPLAPVTAGADAEPDPLLRRRRLAALYLVSQRWSALLTVPVALPVLIHPEPLLRLLTGLADISPTMSLCARLLVVQALVVRLCADPAKQLLVLSGRHWLLAWLTVVEVGLGLGGGALLVWWTASPVAMAGTLAAVSAGAGLLIAVPAACFQTGIDASRAGRELVAPVLGAVAAPVLVGLWWWWRPAGDHLPGLALEGLSVVLASVPGWWLVGLDAAQRAAVRARLARAR